MRFVRPLLCLAIPGLLASCGVTPGTKASLANPDGVWRGTSTRSMAQSRRCPHPSLLRFDVLNRRFQYPWGQIALINVAINPDNTLIGQTGGIVVKGTYSAGRLEGDASTSQCGLHFTATKRE